MPQLHMEPVVPSSWGLSTTDCINTGIDKSRKLQKNDFMVDYDPPMQLEVLESGDSPEERAWAAACAVCTAPEQMELAPPLCSTQC